MLHWYLWCHVHWESVMNISLEKRWNETCVVTANSAATQQGVAYLTKPT